MKNGRNGRPLRKDLNGLKIGFWSVFEFILKNGLSAHRCVCVCGKEMIVLYNALTNGKSKSCGCSANRKHNLKHGMHLSTEYRSWNSMKNRCLNKNDKDYVFYGAKGITVCEEWIKSFEAFYRDMGPKPKGHSLDRIDGNAGYNKDNCRWANLNIQNLNRKFSKNGTRETKQGTFSSKIIFNKKKYYLGIFKTRQEAETAYFNKKKEFLGNL